MEAPFGRPADEGPTHDLHPTCREQGLEMQGCGRLHCRTFYFCASGLWRSKRWSGQLTGGDLSGRPGRNRVIWQGPRRSSQASWSQSLASVHSFQSFHPSRKANLCISLPPSALFLRCELGPRLSDSETENSCHDRPGGNDGAVP